MGTSGSVGGARRIVVDGVTGSGKTTLAARLARLTGLPHHEGDALTWLPGWVTVSTPEQRRRIAELCAGEEWILDTLYGSWSDLPLARAELVVGLDYPRWRSLARLLRRTAVRIVDRRPICNGNRETLRQTLSRDSILAWHFRSFAGKRARFRGWQAAPPGRASVVVLRSPRATRAWLRRVAGPG